MNELSCPSCALSVAFGKVNWKFENTKTSAVARGKSVLIPSYRYVPPAVSVSFLGESFVVT